MGKIEISRRPRITPSAVYDENDIRLVYENHFIDCRNGEIQIRDISGNLIHATVVGPRKFCDHEWVSMKNEVITSGEICLKCNAIRP